MKRPKYPMIKPVMIVTDYPIQNEVERDMAWAGASHLSLLSDIAKAGISQKYLHTTYLSYERPDKDSFDWSTDFKKKKNLPEDASAWVEVPHQKDLYVSTTLWEEFQALLREIHEVKPSIIVVIGKWSLFFLTGSVSYTDTQGSGKSQKPLGGLAKLRASVESVHECFNIDALVFPMLPPVTKQRSPDKIPVIKWDCLKLVDIYNRIAEGESLAYFLELHQEHIIGIDFKEVTTWLSKLQAQLELQPTLVSVDIETKFKSIIDCIGIAYSKNSGICIPFATEQCSSYWSAEEETIIMWQLRSIFQHENCKIIGQNFAYDSQFIHKFWLVSTSAETDTMILHHTLYNNMQKDLAFLASIYCEHYRYWKDDQTHV